MSIPKSLAQLVTLLENEKKTNGKISPKRAKELVLQADVQEDDMMQYADFDHPVEDCYGRQLVFDGGSFEVMVMSWKPGDYSSIHNHGYTQWGVVQVYGNTHHFIYNTNDNQLSFARKEILVAGAAVGVNNGMVHQMGNTTSQNYLTLHVYGSNDHSTGITADAANYDLELDRVAMICGGAFFNLDKDVINYEVGCPKPTREVFMHYSHYLMEYYNRQAQTDEIVSLKKKLIKKVESYIF